MCKYCCYIIALVSSNSYFKFKEVFDYKKQTTIQKIESTASFWFKLKPQHNQSLYFVVIILIKFIAIIYSLLAISIKQFMDDFQL